MYFGNIPCRSIAKNLCKTKTMEKNITENSLDSRKAYDCTSKAGTSYGFASSTQSNHSRGKQLFTRPMNSYGRNSSLNPHRNLSTGVYPRDYEYEKKLFVKSNKGINFDSYSDIPVTLDGIDVAVPMNTFKELDLGEALNLNIEVRFIAVGRS
uniref:DEAD-box ATP-dependent RNA helicase 11 (Trinotate prediction) n=1 Tax=Myxobolus squamalis TaxID=59785 RepID=A0A6B2G214_MYXSQ